MMKKILAGETRVDSRADEVLLELGSVSSEGCRVAYY